LPGTDVWYARPRRYRPGGLKLFSASKCDPARLRSNVSWWRPDCVAGHVRLELRNVDTNYPFERSHRFAGIQPNSDFRDYSRLSCGVGDTQLGRRPGSRLARATPAELARIPRIRAEFRPGRPLAFELQRRGYAARGRLCRDLQQAFCTDAGHH